MRPSPAEVRNRAHAWTLRFWRGDAGVAGRVAGALLWPAEMLFRGTAAARNQGFDRRWLSVAEPPIPVVSVGNLRVGGAGKTPVAAWIAARLRSWGREPAVILRGYGADEVLVHGELNPDVPVHTAVRRLDGVIAAARAGADVAVLDDGFQHRSLARALDVVLIATESFEKRPRLLPRGPWREDLAALRRADLVIVTRKSAPRAAAERVARYVTSYVPSGRVALFRLAPDVLLALDPKAERPVRDVQWLGGRSVLAVASIADPEPFVDHLRSVEAEVELLAYPDHHAFGAADAAAITRLAEARTLVITRKEAVKLRRQIPASVDAWVLTQRVEAETGETMIDDALRHAMAR